jgi:hypothetical protein
MKRIGVFSYTIYFYVQYLDTCIVLSPYKGSGYKGIRLIRVGVWGPHWAS